MHRLDFYFLLMKQPFRPFRLRLSLDITVDVLHPEMAMIEHSTVLIEPPSAPGAIAEDAIIVSLAHIITVQYLPDRT